MHELRTIAIDDTWRLSVCQSRGFTGTQRDGSLDLPRGFDAAFGKLLLPPRMNVLTYLLAVDRSVTTTAVFDSERMAPPRQNGVDEQLQTSYDQPRPTQTTPPRLSASAERQIDSITSTPRTLFENLYNDKVL